MMSDQELVAAANRNFIASARRLVEHCAGGTAREIGGVFAFVTGLPISLFNGCVVSEASTPSDLEAGLTWVRDHGVAHRAWIADDFASELGQVAERLGLERNPVPYPNMVLHPVPVAPTPRPDVVVEDSGRDDFLDASVELGLPRRLAGDVFSPGFVADPDVRLFIGRLGGRLAGTSIAIRSGDAGGVYNVGVLAEARHRGVGSALTWAAVEAGRSWGCETVVLQSTTMALPMYEAMGFRTVVSYAVFGEPSSNATGAEP